MVQPGAKNTERQPPSGAAPDAQPGRQQRRSRERRRQLAKAAVRLIEERGFEALSVNDVAEVEQRPSMEGRKMFVLIAPTAETLKALQKRKDAAEAAGEELVSLSANIEEDLDEDDEDVAVEAQDTAEAGAPAEATEDTADEAAPDA